MLNPADQWPPQRRMVLGFLKSPAPLLNFQPLELVQHASSDCIISTRWTVDLHPVGTGRRAINGRAFAYFTERHRVVFLVAPANPPRKS
jgi:hypothetical protein